jgi:hypothetical protein
MIWFFWKNARENDLSVAMADLVRWMTLASLPSKMYCLSISTK